MVNVGNALDHTVSVHLPEFQRLFAERLRSLRESKRLTQEALESYDLSWKSVQKLEYGITDPKISTLLKLCRAFDLTLPELLQLKPPARRR